MLFVKDVLWGFIIFLDLSINNFSLGEGVLNYKIWSSNFKLKKWSLLRLISLISSRSSVILSDYEFFSKLLFYYIFYLLLFYKSIDFSKLL